MSRSPIDLTTMALKDRIVRQAGYNPQRIKGCVAIQAIPNWEEKLPMFVMKALVSIVKGFSRSKNKRRDTPLTATAVRVARAILPYNDDRTVEENLVVGTLFIEALHKALLVEVERPVVKEMPYTVKWGKRMGEVFDDLVHRPELTGVVFDKPENTEANSRTWKVIGDIDVTRNCIKRSGSKKFEFDANAAWVKSLDKQQQTPLRINTEVFEAMLKNQHLFYKDVSHLPEEERVSSLSKQMAFSFTMSKATVILEHGTFYSMMDTDYRGRFYHIESFMNFQGDDRARSLVLFDNAKVMTPRGKWWLAIHLACLYNATFTKDSDMSWCEEDYVAFMEANSQDTVSVDKMSLNDRANWTYRNNDWIRGLARHQSFALDVGGDFKAEKPCQFLAACIEWNNMLTAEEEGREFLTRLPIAIDGSNNGWQHLAAMSLDKQAGEMVGMLKTRLPNDFYLSTAKDMMEHMDDADLQAILDKMSMAEIRKGISKRGSMVKAYSAGKGAIADNMWADVRQIGFDKKFGITQDNCVDFAKRLDKSIYNVCPGPLDVMKWFQKLSTHCMGTFKWFDPDGKDMTHRRKELMKERSLRASNYIIGEDGEVAQDEDGSWIRKDLTPGEFDKEIEELTAISLELDTFVYKLVGGEGQSGMSWKTPSGFPVMMENFLGQRSTIRVYIDGIKTDSKTKGINLSVFMPTTKPDVRAFASGIAPNFVHSMDAAHLTMVSIKHDGEFLGIHDSFSTHATDVDALVEETKNVFIEMYSYNGETHNVLEDLKHQLLEKPEEFTLPAPLAGELDLASIKESDYFFA